MKPQTDWQKHLREQGFGNQAVIMTIELLKRLDKELTANDLLGLCVCGNPKLPESDFCKDCI